jgi:hypothetical protein
VVGVDEDSGSLDCARDDGERKERASLRGGPSTTAAFAQDDRRRTREKENAGSSAWNSAGVVRPHPFDNIDVVGPPLSEGEVGLAGAGVWGDYREGDFEGHSFLRGGGFFCDAASLGP